MIPLLILVVLVVALVASAYLFGSSPGGSGWEGLGGGGLLVTIVLTVLVVVLWPSMYFSWLDNVAQMEAFQEATFETYIETIEETEGVTLDRSVPWLIDIAYQQQSLAVSDRIKELRDEIDWYNHKLQKGRALKGTPFGVFMPGIPDDLQLITLRINE